MSFKLIPHIFLRCYCNIEGNIFVFLPVPHLTRQQHHCKFAVAWINDTDLKIGTG
jgi:hypothetical protein